MPSLDPGSGGQLYQLVAETRLSPKSRFAVDALSRYVGTVKDPYGRVVGSSVGATLDLGGEFSTVGVMHTGGVFREYPASRIIQAEDGTLILQAVWKAFTKAPGLERSLQEKGFLRKKADALLRMVQKEEISRRVYEEMYDGLVAMREAHERIALQLGQRLDEIEESDEALARFLTGVRLQTPSGQAAEDAYQSTLRRCAEMLSANEAERKEVKRLLDVIGEDAIPESLPRLTLHVHLAGMGENPPVVLRVGDGPSS